MFFLFLLFSHADVKKTIEPPIKKLEPKLLPGKPYYIHCVMSSRHQEAHVGDGAFLLRQKMIFFSHKMLLRSPVCVWAVWQEVTQKRHLDTRDLMYLIANLSNGNLCFHISQYLISVEVIKSVDLVLKPSMKLFLQTFLNKWSCLLVWWECLIRLV